LSIDPAGQFLYVKQLARDPGRLLRVAVADGTAVPIAVPPELRLTQDPMATNAVDSRGRLLFEVCSADSFFFSAGLFDPQSNSVQRIPLSFEGDVWGPAWSPEGGIVSVGAPFASSVWRFHREKQ
jgi:hypothetical protein